jgi:hypothetical protein
LRDVSQGEVPTVVPSLSEPAKRDDFPPDLVLVVNSWPLLSAAIKSAILTLAGTARDTSPASSAPPLSQSTDWYSEGESRTVELPSVQVTVRFIGRKGRRARIAIVAPAGAAFREGPVFE